MFCYLYLMYRSYGVFVSVSNVSVYFVGWAFIVFDAVEPRADYSPFGLRQLYESF